MKRLGSIFKKLLFALACLVTLMFLFYQFENWRGWRAWKNYKAKVERGGESLDPKSIIPPRVPDSSNFAAIPLFLDLFTTNGATPLRTEAEQAKTPLKEFDTALGRTENQQLGVSNTFVLTMIDLRALLAALRSPHTEPDAGLGMEAMRPPYPMEPEPARSGLVINTNMPLAEAGRELLVELKRFDPVYQQLETAAQRPLSRFPIAYEKMPPYLVLLPHLGQLRDASKLVKARASARIASGQNEQALEDLQLMLRLADSVENEPTLISYLVRIALLNQSLEVLALGLANNSWTDPQLAQLQRELLELNLVQDHAKAIHAELVYFGLGSIDYIRRNPNASNTEHFGVPPLLARAMPGGWYFQEMIAYHRLGSLINQGPNPGEKTIDPRRAEDVGNEFESRLSGRNGVALLFDHTFWSRMLLPALTQVTMRTARMQAGVSLAGVACALERYRLAHDKYPESLDHLAPLLEGQAVRDVIDGGPLHYHVEPPSGYVVYSIGWNRTNENGFVKLERSGQPSPAEGDWAWRPLPPMENR
jgi:hypothetical protein